MASYRVSSCSYWRAGEEALEEVMDVCIPKLYPSQAWAEGKPCTSASWVLRGVPGFSRS